MIRVLIVDDEPLARGKIRALLQPHADFEVVAECGDGRDGLKKLKELSPDAVFLDVEMPEMGGMELLSQADGPKPYTVMTTAYDGYAVRAFEYDAVDYLLKPFDTQRFDTALKRIRGHLERDFRSTGRIDVDMMLKRLGGTAPAPRTQPERVPVKIGRRVRFLDAGHMRCIRADRDYVNIHMTTGEIIHTSDRISQMEEKLSGLPFLRVHRSTIVNLEQVREVRSAGNCYDFLLTGDARVTSGCTYKRDIHALLTTWKKAGDKRIG
ncbi:MAG: LytR/AlgR family response regulator transcription factor [Bacillota bacterium]